MANSSIVSEVKSYLKSMEDSNTEKRGRGRPKGSANLTEAERQARYAAKHPYGAQGFGRGRPKGSKNRPTGTSVEEVIVNIGKTTYDGVHYTNQGKRGFFLHGEKLPALYEKSKSRARFQNGHLYAITNPSVTFANMPFFQMAETVPTENDKVMNIVVVEGDVHVDSNAADVLSSSQTETVEVSEAENDFLRQVDAEYYIDGPAAEYREITDDDLSDLYEFVV